MLLLYNNLIDSAALAASSEASGFPASNLKNPFRSKYWRTAGATAGTAQLVIDHGAAVSVGAFALTGYDWISAPGTLQVEFNTTDDWGAPAKTEALTWKSPTTPGGNKGCIIKKLATAWSYRFNRLSVVYAPGTVPTDWNLGRLFVGPCFEPSQKYDYGYQESIVDPSILSQTIGGQSHADEIERYRAFSASGVMRTQAQWVLFQAMINTVGTRKEIFAALDYTNEAEERTIYGRFANPPAITRVGPQEYRYSFSIEEAR